MKGFLGGVSIGTLVAVSGAAMWSLSTPMPTRVEVATKTPDRAVQPDTTETPPSVEGQTRDADLVEAAPVSPETTPGEDPSPIASVDTEPGQKPLVGVATGVSQGDISSGASVKTLPSGAGQSPSVTASAVAPQQPGGESDLEVSTQTAALPEPEPEPEPEPVLETDQAVVDPDAAGAGQTDAGISGSPSVVATVTLPGIGDAPSATALPTIVISPSARNVPDVQARETDNASGSEPAASAGDVPVSAAPAQEDSTDAGEDADAPSRETGVALPTTDSETRSSGPQIGTRVVPLTERDRTAEAEVPTPPGDATAEGAADALRTPFEANAQPYKAQDSRPLMSIVLIDDADAIGAEALAEFPYPLTFAIDPNDPKAAEKMKTRRAAGFEVLILADLPREAAPQDAETAMAVWLKSLPLAVGVLEGVETGFQGNRPLADQMVVAIEGAGLGMVMQNSGLNTVQKLALRDGLASGVVFRDFDGAGQNPRAIRRFLDQAAFRARQEGAVIMLGRLRPETISALLLWGLQDRASQVGLAPVSAGLLANLEP